MPDSVRSLMTTPNPRDAGNLAVLQDDPTVRDLGKGDAEPTSDGASNQAGAWLRSTWSAWTGNAWGGWSLLWLVGVALLRSDRVNTPIACGFFRSCVVLPSQADGWDEQRRRMVLRHELAHVERRDCLVHLVVHLACCLHWLNPLVWLAAWRYTLERERACDDRVLSLGARPTDYASHLLGIASTRSSRRLPALSAVALSIRLSAIRLSTVGMARSSELEGRLLAILDGDLRRGISRRAGIFTALSVLSACLALAIVHPVIGDENEAGAEKGAAAGFLVTLGATHQHSDRSWQVQTSGFVAGGD